MISKEESFIVFIPMNLSYKVILTMHLLYKARCIAVLHQIHKNKNKEICMHDNHYEQKASYQWGLKKNLFSQCSSQIYRGAMKHANKAFQDISTQ